MNNGGSLSYQGYYDPTQDDSGNCRALVVAVIANAVKEAQGKGFTFWASGNRTGPEHYRKCKKYRDSARLKLKKEALEWITCCDHNLRDEPFSFPWCCDQLGLEYKTTSERLLRLIDSEIERDKQFKKAIGKHSRIYSDGGYLWVRGNSELGNLINYNNLNLTKWAA